MAKYQLTTKPHQIDIDDLRKFMLEEKVLFASSSKEQKQLYINLRRSFEVWHNKKLVLETMEASDAVNKYNEI